MQTFNWTNMELKLLTIVQYPTHSYLLIEPIWNWNCELPVVIWGDVLTFNWTNMELKRSTPGGNPTPRRSFNWTNMELKHKELQDILMEKEGDF